MAKNNNATNNNSMNNNATSSYGNAPVSYTHLDVYKRQILRMCLKV